MIFGRSTTRRFGFTLTELLVVIAIIAILGVGTVIGFQTVSRDAKISSAANLVMATLDQARGLAMKKNNYVMVVFRTRIDDDNKQVVEVITTEWSKVSSGPCVAFISAALRRPVDRHVIAPGIPIRTLPSDISIAAPTYGYAPAGGFPSDQARDLFESQWFSLSNFKNDLVAEAPGQMIGVLYSPEGTVVSRNMHVDSYRQYVDFNRDGIQSTIDENGSARDYPHDVFITVPCGFGPQMSADAFDETAFYHQLNGPEPFVLVSPYLVIFDDAEARELAPNPDQWGNIDTRRAELSEYITAYGSRIHFNRYSGVVTR